MSFVCLKPPNVPFSYSLKAKGSIMAHEALQDPAELILYHTTLFLAYYPQPLW